jgi:hypothetical protein
MPVGAIPQVTCFFPPSISKDRDSQERTEQRDATQRHVQIKHSWIIHRIPIV